MEPWSFASIGALILELLSKEEATPALEEGRRVAVSQAKRLWTEYKWSAAEDGYRQRLLPFVRTTRLLGNPKPVEIDTLYTDLLVYDKLSAQRRSDALVDPQTDTHDVGDQRERRSALEVVETRQNLYLLGHPGAGKTTFLRYLAIRGCKGLMAQVPVYLQLRDLALVYRSPPNDLQGDDRFEYFRKLIVDAIVGEFTVCQFPDAEQFVKALLTKGNALVLLDGLDEVPSANGAREAFIRSVRELQRQYPQTQICLTCRIAASEYTFEHFSYAEVARFTPEQQETFIRRWYWDQPLKRDHILQQWAQEHRRPLRDLGRTPLLLALICLSFDDLPDLPDRYVDLFREALAALMRRWDSTRLIEREKFYAELNPHRREELLQELAAALLQADKIVFTAEEAAPIIQGWFSGLPEGPVPNWQLSPVRELLDHVESQHGLIIQRAKEQYSFAHLTIQEFLAARSIAQGHPSRRLADIANQKLFDQRWREVLVFCAGLLQDGTQFLEMLVAASAQPLSKQDELVSFLSQLEGSYWKVSNKATPAPIVDVQELEVEGRVSRTARSLALRIVARLDKLAWAGKQHPLRVKAAIAVELLSAAQTDPKHAFNRLNEEGSTLSRYLHAVGVVVDCVSVANCRNRDRVGASLLTLRRQ
jgi:hypothetical protein